MSAATMPSKVSPGPRGLSGHFAIHEDAENDGSPKAGTKNNAMNSPDGVIPLVSSKFGNTSRSTSFAKNNDHLPTKAKSNNDPNMQADDDSAMDDLLAKLSEQQALLEHQKNALASTDSSAKVDQSETESTPEPLATKASNEKAEKSLTDPSEVDRLKQQLDAAKSRIAQQDQELTQTRTTKHPASHHVHLDDSKSEASDVGTGRGANIWTNANANVWNQGVGGRSWTTRPMAQPFPAVMPQPQMRNFSHQTSPVSSSVGHRFLSDMNQYQGVTGIRRSNTQTRNQVFGQPRNVWDSYGAPDSAPMMGLTPYAQPIGMFSMGYQPRPIGAPLSPTAAEFTANSIGGPWNSTPSSPGQTYVSPMEPLNYRRLLDRSVTCNWKYIVDKIVCNNDQQASIFLQQKLKVGTAEQKFEIVEAIVAQAYPLMVNRFGNFLVQRCFEHGTPEQVVAIANAIRGNTLSLSMDAFGCHVVQKAFDAVPEEYKAIMVHELLRRIPETVIHRYACHVWQKLFELRWSDSPPQIMKYVNEALRGMWHEVALGETGSLVVQNIFENCLEEDKRPCINEVLHSIDIVAHGQFGNWCIQHICEHGAPADRSRAIDHVLRYATEYSMDQFASKVVEKCLKIGGAEFLERYLDRVCEGRPDRPRIPLIDISSDQYGNYLIQYILTHANAQHREIVASHIRKHMVSLRGSKFGSRVGLLCCNPAYATRPGPAVSGSTTRYSTALSTSSRYGVQFR